MEGALAELDWLIGLDPVKQQVRAIAAQLRVAKMRSRQGLSSQPPARHFVFTGPPGTGKTTVSRILGRIFAAHGLLVRPEVIEAHRADLVGEHLGSTAIKTNKLIDSAMGGVLFIDEAYSLNNVGYDGGDAFGAEAVQTLLKRAEDDRDRLVIVLAGYPDDMDRFLRSNPGPGVAVQHPGHLPQLQPGRAGGDLRTARRRGLTTGSTRPPSRCSAPSSPTPAPRAGSTSWATAGSPGPCTSAPAPAATCGWRTWPTRRGRTWSSLTAADVQAAYGELDHGGRPADGRPRPELGRTGRARRFHGQPGAVLATGG